MSCCLRRAWDVQGVPLSVIGAITLLMACHGGNPAEPTAAAVRVSISPPGLSLVVGDIERLTAQAYDARGRTTNASVQWSSANPDIASVGKSDGIVTAISAGTTGVTATAGTRSATVTVSVLPAGPARLSISTSALGLLVGWVDRLTAQAFDAKGRTIMAAFEWSSADPAIASVGKSDGIVTALSAGATTVTATVGTLSATATVSVSDAVGAIAFARMSYAGDRLTADVLSYSVADRTIRSLPRATQFTAIAAPAWSPDGTLLAVEVIGDVFNDDINHWFDYTSNLYILRAAATADSPWRALTVDGLSRSPSWSPDGARIAYVQRPMRSDNSHIYLIDAGGGETTRLTRTDGAYRTPVWSPDGTRLAFSDGGVGNSDIFIVNSDGSGLINVTQSPAYDAGPSWSPDGARLAFFSDRDDKDLEVYVVDVDGRNLRRLTNQLFGGGSSGPVWSPDGRQIAFSLAASREDRSGIYIMNADGSFPIRLTQPPPNSWDSVPAWRR